MLRGAVAQYEKVVHDIVSRLPESERIRALNDISAIRQRVESAIATCKFSDLLPLQSRSPARSQPQSPQDSQRYLGEISDVRFFNLIKQALQDTKIPTEHGDEGLDSYEQDDPRTAGLSGEHPGVSIGLPKPGVAAEYLEIYFSTINIAYPFLQKAVFLKQYENLRDSTEASGVDNSWLATLCMAELSGPGRECANKPLYRCCFCHWGLLHILPWTGTEYIT